jgi:hypothetical protein
MPMTDYETRKHELELELMSAQIDKTRVDIEKMRMEMRWEPWKALAAMAIGVAAVSSAILAVGHFIH